MVPNNFFGGSLGESDDETEEVEDEAVVQGHDCGGLYEVEGRKSFGMESIGRKFGVEWEGGMAGTS